MLVSMTGFATQTKSLTLKSGETVAITVEIKSLNTRFFEATCKLPTSLSHFEIELSNQLKAALIRGRVFCSIKITGDLGNLEIPVASTSLARHYVETAQRLQKELALPGQVTINDLLQFPMLFSLEKMELNSQENDAIKSLVTAAIADLQKDREREGKAMLADLTKRITICEDRLEAIKKMYEELISKQKELITETSKLVHEEQEGEKARLDEMYVLLNKMDVNEEIARFTSHMSAIRDILQLPQIEKSRKLDFLLQELMREVNTITAKCSNYGITAAAVDIKVEVEKAREQVQNVI